MLALSSVTRVVKPSRIIFPVKGVPKAVRLTRQDLLRLATLALMLTVMTAVAFADTPTPITIDPAPLFESISTYVPMFFGILAVAGGILIGKRIAEYVIKAIADAF